MRPKGVKRPGKKVVITPNHFILSPEGTTDSFLLHYKEGKIKLEGRLPPFTLPNRTEHCFSPHGVLKETHVKPLEKSIQFGGGFCTANEFEAMLVESLKQWVAHQRQANNLQKAG